ncbi:N-acetylmuramoyl-L-alanine amidase [Bacillus badius]|uniref:Phage lysin, N-acetylmuramoyl-L-alanine amidase n=1 Tax=Bacillus badius TaxID=1455 RepID=A0ABR5AXZ0_BACBA|nr:N-acetylmuramoyl-L-alanine amidase [Bacillus badius]KIL79610.1 Phage lysin, N-acetylmuramoyl-L-alanine amidase [Bacillus badius]MED4716305.1 N-acetylmuramoyl-L-alanine amidase [Bacillus badius]
MMSKNIIVCGHGAGDPGAADNGINERDFIRQELAPRIKKYSGGEIEIYDMSKNCYRETKDGRGIHSLKGKIVIEFHLDAASKTSKGGHIIFGAGLKADSLDNRLADVIKKHFGWRHDRAFHPRDNLLNANTAKRIGVNYRLVEVCFVTNPTEVAYLKKNIDQIAKDFAEAITNKVAAGSNKPSTSTPGKYRVYTGIFKTDEEAKKQAKLIGAKLGYKPFPKEKRVWTGVFNTLESAMTAQQKISREFGFNPQIRKED